MRKNYIITRDAGGRVHATVMEEGGPTYPLPHLEHHSPDGFNFGYGGSGPADLARSIVGDLQGRQDPRPADYQAVKDRLLAPLETDGPHEITEAQIIDVLNDVVMGR